MAAPKGNKNASGQFGNKNAAGNSGKPSKIKPFTIAMRELFKLLENDKQILKTGSTFVFTDNELLDMINMRLDKKDRVAISTFYHWKKLYKKGNEQKLPKEFKEFVELLKGALVRQKLEIMHLIVQSQASWQRFAWMMERKFEDWRIPKDGGDDPNKIEDGRLEPIQIVAPKTKQIND